MSEQSQHSG